MKLYFKLGVGLITKLYCVRYPNIEVKVAMLEYHIDFIEITGMSLSDIAPDRKTFFQYTKIGE